MQKRKIQGEVTIKSRKKHKADKLKQITPMVLTEGDLDQIIDKVLEITAES